MARPENPSFSVILKEPVQRGIYELAQLSFIFPGLQSALEAYYHGYRVSQDNPLGVSLKAFAALYQKRLSPVTVGSDFESIFAIEKARLQTGEPLSRESFRRAWHPFDLNSYSFNLPRLTPGRIVREGSLWREIEGDRNTHRLWVALTVDSLSSQIRSSQRTPFAPEPVAKPFKIPPPRPRWQDEHDELQGVGSAVIKDVVTGRVYLTARYWRNYTDYGSPIEIGNGFVKFEVGGDSWSGAGGGDPNRRYRSEPYVERGPTRVVILPLERVTISADERQQIRYIQEKGNKGRS